MTQYQLEEVVVMKPVRTGALFSSNITQNAGVVQVKEQYSTLEGQAVGQTGNNYLRTLPIGSFGQNFGGRTF